MKIYKLLISLLLPGLAILLASLAQQALVAAWPGIRDIHFSIVTIDSYFVALSSGLFCFFAGSVLQRRVGTRLGLICAVVLPLGYLCLILWALIGHPMLEFGAKIAWTRPIVLFMIAAAILPLLGLVLGWLFSSAGVGMILEIPKSGHSR